MGQIVITEFIDDEAVATLCSLHDVVYDPTLGDDRARLLPLLRACDALIVRNRTTVDALLLDEAPTLAVIGRLGVGLDNIDLEACHTRGIAVRRAVGANADAVAEYVIGALLVLTRGAFLSTARMVRGEWPRTELSGLEVRGRTMGLVGFGDVARRVAVQAAALAMEVVAYDPFLPDTDPVWETARKVEFRDLLKESDAISIHVPLTKDTAGLIGERELAAMRNTAVLINTARGGIVDEEALISALRDGRIRGAAMDVFTEEPLTTTASAFDGVPNLILTPHVAGVTSESNHRVSAVIASEVLSVLAEGRR